MALDDKQLAKIKKIAQDFYLYCENNLKILDKDGRLVPLEPNRIQKEIVDYVIECLETDRPIRAIILKARQEGVSTIIEALIFWWTSTNRNVHSKIIAHESDAAINLYQMFQRYYDNANPFFKPKTKYLTKYDLMFDNEEGTGLKSNISTSSAQNTETGRSQTIHWLHACIAGDTKLIQPDGSTIKMKDVDVGDRLIAEDGSPTKVTNKWETGTKPIKQIKLWLGNETIKVSPDHKIRVAKHGYNNRLSDPIWKKAEDLTEDDWVLWAYPKTKSTIKFLTLDTYNCVYDDPEPTTFGNVTTDKPTLKTDHKLGYLFGYYLAEGHSKQGQIQFTAHKDENFHEYISDIIDCKQTVKIEGNKKIITFYSTPLVRLIDKHVGRVESKHVPEKWLYNMPKPFLQGLYDGWKDGDGSKTREDTCSITSIHERIARQMRQLYINLNHQVPGIKYRKNRDRYGVKTKPVYVLTDNKTSGSKRNKYRHVITRKLNRRNGYIYVRVKSIEDKPPEPTYEIEVDHKSHAFLTVGGVVSNSETAFWPKGEKLVAGLMQTVPMRPKTAIFLESTANGVGDFFYKTWQAAKKEESALKPFFFPWFIHDEYQLNIDKLDDLTAEEKKWKKQYDITDGQIAWYRMKSKEFAHDPKKMAQEYPFNEQEAFMSAGRPRFDPYKVQEMEKEAFRATQYELIEKDGFIPKPVPGAPLRVWEQPQEDHKYVIGADVADTGEDKSVATVMDIDRTKTVARWVGDIEPSDFGEVIEQLGRWYNMALVGVEVNNHGLTTVQRLRDMGYENLYRRERGQDERWEQSTSKLGWLTNRKTKSLMVDGLAEVINTGQLTDPDPDFVRECYTFVVDDRGRTNAQQGSHDDIVMSTAIALQLFDWNDIVKTRRRVPSYKPQNYMQRKRQNRMAMNG